jgi:hypothetical protein
MSYNPNTAARPWVVVGAEVHLTAASIGQEFIVDATTETLAWAYDLIRGSSTWRASDFGPQQID